MARKYKRYKREPWKINPDAVREAAQMLGLTMPVRFKDLADYDGEYALKWSTAGLYSSKSPKRHIIYLRANLFNRARANQTIWHELAHAYQREHGCDGTKMLPNDARKKWMGDDDWAYWRKPIEVHARYVADTFAPMLDLTLPTC